MRVQTAIANSIFAFLACSLSLAVISWFTILPAIGLLFLAGYLN